MIYNYIIIGAGLSGLTTAKLLSDKNIQDILVLDKSRGVGGRMATRRTLDTKFDHGAQFYRRTSDSEHFHKLWFQENITSLWFHNEKGEYWKSVEGMTAFPKSLVKSMAEKVSVELEKEISGIQFENGLWILTSTKNEQWRTRNLVISSPLPQTIKLLKSISNQELLNLDKLSELQKINYTKALIGLVTTEEEISLNDFGYLEFTNSPFFSVTSMKHKGISQIFAYTITMSAEFSEKYFEEEDSATSKIIIQKIQEKFGAVAIKNFELKKWRYCMPTSTYTKYSEEIAPNLFLIGDSFGGPSLLGAIRSGAHLAKSITVS